MLKSTILILSACVCLYGFQASTEVTIYARDSFGARLPKIGLVLEDIVTGKRWHTTSESLTVPIGEYRYTAFAERHRPTEGRIVLKAPRFELWLGLLREFAVHDDPIPQSRPTIRVTVESKDPGAVHVVRLVGLLTNATFSAGANTSRDISFASVPPGKYLMFLVSNCRIVASKEIEWTPDNGIDGNYKLP